MTRESTQIHPHDNEGSEGTDVPAFEIPRCRPGYARVLLGYVDHDLAEMRARLQVAVGLLRLGKGEDAVHHRRDAGAGKEVCCLLEHGAATDVDPDHPACTGHQGEGIELAAKAADAADDGDGAADSGRREGAGDGSLAADFQHDVDPPVVGPPQDFRLPFRDCTIVDRLIGAQGTRSLELFVAGRGNDRAQAGCLGHLQAQNRNPAGAEQEDTIPRLHAGDLEDGVPGGDAGAGKRRCLQVAQVLRDIDERILMKRDGLAEHAIDIAAKRTADLDLIRLPFQPPGKEGGRDAITNSDASDLGADLDHLSRTVGSGNDRGIHLHRVGALGDHEIPVIQGYGFYSNFYFVGVKGMFRDVRQLQAVNLFAVPDTICLHYFS